MRSDTEREELKVKILEVLLEGEKGIEEISLYTGRKEEAIKEALKSLESQTCGRIVTFHCDWVSGKLNCTSIRVG